MVWCLIVVNFIMFICYFNIFIRFVGVYFLYLEFCVVYVFVLGNISGIKGEKVCVVDFCDFNNESVLILFVNF